MARILGKANYVANSLSKMKHKRWELYVISRVIHLLDDLEIEFICQQVVLPDDGGRKFADLYFPQFNIYLEVNERGGHSKEVDQKLDKVRQGEILRAVGARQEKIEIFSFDEQGGVLDSSLEGINQKIDNFVTLLKKYKQEHLLRGAFEPWDPSKKHDPAKFLKKGYLDVSENPSFLTHRDALRCFGYTKGHYQKAVWRAASWENAFVWFPHFIKHKDWLNIFSEDEKVITETMLTSNENTRQRIEASDTNQVRYTFAKTRDKLGNTLYRFVGVFKNISKSEDVFGRLVFTHEKVSDKISIPDPQGK
jgi:hypothetical protein